MEITSEVWRNTLGMQFVTIEPGEFLMGSGDEYLPPELVDADNSTPGGAKGRFADLRPRGEYDEYPRHRVTISRSFQVGMHPVTNAQFEEFDPSHRSWRGFLGFSPNDNDAVINVTWHQAVAFCDWLSQREGMRYRLPTEAEWEYAARAGTTTIFSSGDTLPPSAYKNQRLTWYPDPTEGPYDLEQEVPSLEVGLGEPNPWGLYDIHGTVEEWCLDWYGPYSADDQVDPLGYADGDFRVTRGGSHSTEPFFLRSANRAGTLPEDFSWLIGFRVVIGDLPAEPAPPIQVPTPVHLDVRQEKPAVTAVSADTPFFAMPRPYVKIPPDQHGPIFSEHNHCPSIIECPNGDLLAAWFSCELEAGREMTLAASRLRHGNDAWDDASLFWDAPDRNMTAAFFHREGDTIHLYGALGIGGTWGQMVIYHRQSTDSGAHWSPARIILGDHTIGQVQPANLPFRTKEGVLVVPADDTAVSGSRLNLSFDNGATWRTPPGRMAGIHAAVAENNRGEIIAFGRMFRPESEKMPVSVSTDLGETFERSWTEFDSIRGGQRPVLLPLQEGPLMLCSFARDIAMTDVNGDELHGSGLFAALSWDGGYTWPARRLVTLDSGTHQFDGGAWTRTFTMTPFQGEPKGYLTATQGTDGTIHLISSRIHYAFNFAWLQTPMPGPAATDE